MELEYNTQRTALKLREYGRNVQNLIAHLRTIKDKEERGKKAATLVELMKLINPDLNKDSTENEQKIWDDLHIISNFELDLEGPFPKPDKEVLKKKPERMKYYSNEIKYKHYGRGLELLIEQVTAIKDPKEKEGAVVAIGRLMKGFYQAWNKDTIEDEQVLKNIKKLSNNQLDINIETVKELRLFDSERKSGGGGRRSGNNKGRNNKGGGRNNQGVRNRRRN
ncbi:MAG: DUF4290 domain-containing protein [Ekhidna sp.]|nr:DUF4290 domain-containing protein [Ekhidna sp.]MBC6409960.1 DUF4290 domain-containing protein [Ekhidna sp.]MBC6425244.1 DUF4290 domain-containing protein [Ekhidna sp.]